MAASAGDALSRVINSPAPVRPQTESGDADLENRALRRTRLWCQLLGVPTRVRADASFSIASSTLACVHSCAWQLRASNWYRCADPSRAALEPDGELTTRLPPHAASPRRRKFAAARKQTCSAGQNASHRSLSRWTTVAIPIVNRSRARRLCISLWL